MIILGQLHNQNREILTGTAKDDTIYPGGGWDVVDGGDGFDTVVIVGSSTQFKIVFDSGVTYIDALSGASAAAISYQRVAFVSKAATGFAAASLVIACPAQWRN